MPSTMKFLRLPPTTRVRQRGNGIGTWLSRLGRYIIPALAKGAQIVKPIAKKALKEVGKGALEVGSNILSDVASGKNLKKSIKERGEEGIGNVKNVVKKGALESGGKILDAIKGQAGFGISSRPKKRKATAIFSKKGSQTKSCGKKKFKSVFDR